MNKNKHKITSCESRIALIVIMFNNTSYFVFSFLSTDIDECSPNPCLNDGTCVDGINEFTCQCANGWEGKQCDIGKPFFKETTLILKHTERDNSGSEVANNVIIIMALTVS